MNNFVIKFPNGFLEKLSDKTRKEIELVASNFVHEMLYEYIPYDYQKPNKYMPPHTTLGNRQIATALFVKIESVDTIPKELREKDQLMRDSQELKELKKALGLIKDTVGAIK